MERPSCAAEGCRIGYWVRSGFPSPVSMIVCGECIAVDTVAALRALIVRKGVEVVLLDTRANLTPGLLRPLAACARDHGVGIVLVGSRGTVCARCIVAVAATGPCEVVLEPFDDSNQVDRAVLAAASHASIQALLLAALAEPFEKAPDSLLSHLIGIVIGVSHIDSPAILAQESAVTRRTLDRWFRRMGLKSVRLFLAAARAVRAVPALRRRNEPLREIAKRTRFGSEGSLHRQTLALTGLAPREAVGTLSDEELVTVIVSRLRFRPPKAA